MPTSEPLKARPIGLRTASTITASGIGGNPPWRRRGPAGAGRRIVVPAHSLNDSGPYRGPKCTTVAWARGLRDEHELLVRRLGLPAPRLTRPVERKGLA